MYERLGKNKEALSDARKVIESTPTQWQGYARCARLLLKFNKTENALKMADFAIARVAEKDEKRRDELLAFKEQISERIALYRSLTTYHFGNLPLEIAHEIFSYVICVSSSAALRLSHVCHQWREVVLNTPSFWKTLTLTGRRCAKKAKLWRVRSNGRVEELWLGTTTFRYDPSLSEELAGFTWEHLRALRISAHIVLEQDSPIPFTQKLFTNLEEFTIFGEPINHDIMFHPGMQARALEIRDSSIATSIITESFKHLESLICIVNIEGMASNSTLLELLRANPALHTLRMSCLASAGLWALVADTTDSTIVDMSHLSRLEMLNLSDYFRILTAYVRLPSLQSLKINSMPASLDLPFTQLLQHHPALTLAELSIRKCSVSATVLSDVIKACPCLEKLTLMALSGIGAVVELLAQTTPLICPQLRHLDLTNTVDLTTGPVVRSLKARPAEDGVCTKLQSLILDGCPLIDPEMHTWFRVKVARFSCVYASKKQAKRTTWW